MVIFDILTAVKMSSVLGCNAVCTYRQVLIYRVLQWVTREVSLDGHNKERYWKTRRRVTI